MKCDLDPCNCLICNERCSFFSRLGPGELEKLNLAKRTIKYRKGEAILKKGSYNPYVALLSSGFAKVIIDADMDKKFIMEILGKHHFIALDLFGDNIVKSTVVAVTEATVCYLPISIIVELLERNSTFGSDIMRYHDLLGSIRHSRLKSVTLKQSRGKIADVLLYVDALAESGTVMKVLSRRDLADMANISMENAIRTLREFENSELISIDRKDIRIIDKEALTKISLYG